MVHALRNRVDVANRSVVALSRPASTIGIDATLDDALRVLLATDSTNLVVVAPDGHVVGVLGSRHLVGGWADDPEAFAVTPVSAVLDPAPIVAPTATVRIAACVVRDYRGDVVVIIGDGLVATVTAGELLAALADFDHDRIALDGGDHMDIWRNTSDSGAGRA